jgi:hypothetical protein
MINPAKFNYPVAAKVVLCNWKNAIFPGIFYRAEKYCWISAQHLNTCDTFDNLTALYFAAVASMDTDANASNI